jgi:hypothetical protein
MTRTTAALLFAASLLFFVAMPVVEAQQLSDFREATASEKTQYTCIPCTQQCAVCNASAECSTSCRNMGNPRVLKGVGCGVRRGYVIC